MNPRHKSWDFSFLGPCSVIYLTQDVPKHGFSFQILHPVKVAGQCINSDLLASPEILADGILNHLFLSHNLNIFKIDLPIALKDRFNVLPAYGVR